MRASLFLLLLFVKLSPSLAQVQQQQTLTAPANVYAIVVGISKYDNDIPQLDYAHNDASVFAGYLKSKAGGSVPEDHIRLLVNEDATFSAIYDAFNWLLETCQKDDLVYFYFSGHGDLEKKTIYQLGYLLAFNTPRSNYINNAVRIEDLNNVANTLSVEKKAKVVLITDACHSGKLAGSDFNGNKLVADQLKAIKNSEVRIASCEPDQLSNEDEGWGGGRGVFSYYLVKGLEGLADEQKDGIVTVNEIKRYLNTSLANDPLLAQKINKQTPVIDGVDNLKLSKVDITSLDAVQQQDAPARPLLKSLGVQPQAFLFDIIKQDNIERLADFDVLNRLPAQEIPFAFIQMVKDSILYRGPDDSDSTSVSTIDDNKFNLLVKTLKENSDALKRFNDKLVVTLSDHGQSIINLYLEGDAAELERRRYYNAYSSGYDIYPEMFAVALKLISPEHFLHKILRVKFHYFSGVAARLKTPTVENAKPLLDLALAEMKKAEALEKNAAYIYMELGVIHDYIDEPAIAEKYYLKATEIAPKWAMPWSNLVGLYAGMKQYNKALEASKTAIELKSDFQGVYVNTGLVYRLTGNLLLAETLFRKSIKMNTRHYLPYENLGLVYLYTTQYGLADRFFYEADVRKKGFNNPRLMKLPKPVLDDADVDGVTDQFDQCLIIDNDYGKNDVVRHFIWGLSFYERGELADAESEFKKVISLDKNNPLVFHYLGKLLYEQQRWKEADIMLNLAVSNYLPDSSFRLYIDTLANFLPESSSKECIIGHITGARYSRIDDHYYLADLYEKWDHYGEAEMHYRTIINMQPESVAGYFKLWRMLEHIGRYQDAEEMMKTYSLWNEEIASRELNEFYKRMTMRYPSNVDWRYKAGLMLYHYSKNRSFRFDRKKIEDDSDKEIFVNQFRATAGMDTLAREIISPVIGDTIRLSGMIIHPYSEGIAYLKKADSLLEDPEMLADVNYKIGDLYNSQGLPERSVPFYKKTVDLKPGDATGRSKLAEAYTVVYYLKEALDQLDTLYLHKKINFKDQLLMAEYCIHAARFTDAAALLKETSQVHPINADKVADLTARLQLLSNHPKEALKYYKEWLAVHPADSLTMYTIARLHAKMKNKREALKWLKMSIDHGLQFYWIVKMDPAWNEYRSASQWITITRKLDDYKEY